MTKKAHKTQRNRWDDLVRFLCFLVLGTVGMGVMGLALLAEPIDGYYADRAFIQAQQQQIAQLQRLYRQQEELLANAENPSVIERSAVSNFKYVPLSDNGGSSTTLPKEWPNLKEALSKINDLPPAESKIPWRALTERLAGQPERQLLLMALGAALVIVVLACFYRLR
ncbi:MAG: hypothetical protein AMJ79_02745 [Phycisphaerae bacterium SM23_30]|nr:MAG: hypothetical protein AMJ79_02745 [Phycisphaerae bacterium SM23_30]